MDDSVERKTIAFAGITCRDVTPVYISCDPYHEVFEERLDTRKYRAYNKCAGGMVFDMAGERLALTHVVPSLPAARV